jgi:sulfur carrier protein ThiS
VKALLELSDQLNAEIITDRPPLKHGHMTASTSHNNLHAAASLPGHGVVRYNGREVKRSGHSHHVITSLDRLEPIHCIVASRLP